MITAAGRAKRLTLLGLLAIAVGLPIAEEFGKPGFGLVGEDLADVVSEWLQGVSRRTSETRR